MNFRLKHFRCNISVIFIFKPKHDYTLLPVKLTFVTKDSKISRTTSPQHLKKKQEKKYRKYLDATNV